MNNSPTTTYHPRNSSHARNQFTETDNRGQNRYKINPCHLINQLFAKPKRLIRPELNHRVILRFVIPPSCILGSRPAKKQEYPLVSIRIERVQDIPSLELGQTVVRYKFQTPGYTSPSMVLFAARVWPYSRVSINLSYNLPPSPLPLCTRVCSWPISRGRATSTVIQRENTGKKAKRKQAYFLAVEWTFVYENGFGRKPTTATSQPTRLSGSIQGR